MKRNTQDELLERIKNLEADVDAFRRDRDELKRYVDKLEEELLKFGYTDDNLLGILKASVKRGS